MQQGQGHADWDPAQYVWDRRRLVASHHETGQPGDPREAQPDAAEQPQDADPDMEHDDEPSGSSQRPGGESETCMVKDCQVDLSQCKAYYRRFRICERHLKMLSLCIEGKLSRFCQQCGRFHVLEEFEGQKRSCRRALLTRFYKRRNLPVPPEAMPPPAPDSEPIPSSPDTAAKVKARPRQGGPGQEAPSQPPQRRKRGRPRAPPMDVRDLSPEQELPPGPHGQGPGPGSQGRSGGVQGRMRDTAVKQEPGDGAAQLFAELQQRLGSAQGLLGGSAAAGAGGSQSQSHSDASQAKSSSSERGASARAPPLRQHVPYTGITARALDLTNLAQRPAGMAQQQPDVMQQLLQPPPQEQLQQPARQQQQQRRYRTSLGDVNGLVVGQRGGGLSLMDVGRVGLGLEAAGSSGGPIPRLGDHAGGQFSALQPQQQQHQQGRLRGASGAQEPRVQLHGLLQQLVQPGVGEREAGVLGPGGMDGDGEMLGGLSLRGGTATGDGFDPTSPFTVTGGPLVRAGSSSGTNVNLNRLQRHVLMLGGEVGPERAAPGTADLLTGGWVGSSGQRPLQQQQLLQQQQQRQQPGLWHSGAGGGSVELPAWTAAGPASMGMRSIGVGAAADPLDLELMSIASESLAGDQDLPSFLLGGRAGPVLGMPPMPTGGPTVLSSLLARPQLQSSSNTASGMGGHGSSSASAEMARSLRQQLLQRGGASGSYPHATTAGPAIAPDGSAGLRTLDSFLGVQQQQQQRQHQQQQQQGPFQPQSLTLDAPVGARGVSGSSPFGASPMGAFTGSGTAAGLQGEQYRGDFQAVQRLRQQEQQLLGMQQQLQQQLLQQQQQLQQGSWGGLGGGGGGAGPVGNLDEMESTSLQGRRQSLGLAGAGTVGHAPQRRDALSLQPQQLQQSAGLMEFGAGQLDLKAAAQGILAQGGLRSQYVPPSTLMERVSIKLHNCRPEQLAPDVARQLQEWVATADSTILQGFVRPGCTNLILDLLFSDRGRLGALFAPGATEPWVVGNGLARRVLGSMGMSLRDGVTLQYGSTVLEMQNGQVRLFHRAQLPGAPGAASAAATAAASPRGAAAAAAEACEPWCSDGSWVGPELMAVAPLATVVGRGMTLELVGHSLQPRHGVAYHVRFRGAHLDAMPELDSGSELSGDCVAVNETPLHGWEELQHKQQQQQQQQQHCSPPPHAAIKRLGSAGVSLGPALEQQLAAQECGDSAGGSGLVRTVPAVEPGAGGAAGDSAGAYLLSAQGGGDAGAAAVCPVAIGVLEGMDLPDRLSQVHVSGTLRLPSETQEWGSGDGVAVAEKFADTLLLNREATGGASQLGASAGHSIGAGSCLEAAPPSRLLQPPEILVAPALASDPASLDGTATTPVRAPLSRQLQRLMSPSASPAHGTSSGGGSSARDGSHSDVPTTELSGPSFRRSMESSAGSLVSDASSLVVLFVEPAPRCGLAIVEVEAPAGLPDDDGTSDTAAPTDLTYSRSGSNSRNSRLSSSSDRPLPPTPDALPSAAVGHGVSSGGGVCAAPASAPGVGAGASRPVAGAVGPTKPVLSDWWPVVVLPSGAELAAEELNTLTEELQVSVAWLRALLVDVGLVMEAMDPDAPGDAETQDHQQYHQQQQQEGKAGAEKGMQAAGSARTSSGVLPTGAPSQGDTGLALMPLSDPGPTGVRYRGQPDAAAAAAAAAAVAHGSSCAEAVSAGQARPLGAVGAQGGHTFGASMPTTNEVFITDVSSVKAACATGAAAAAAATTDAPSPAATAVSVATAATAAAASTAAAAPAPPHCAHGTAPAPGLLADVRNPYGTSFGSSHVGSVTGGAMLLSGRTLEVAHSARSPASTSSDSGTCRQAQAKAHAHVAGRQGTGRATGEGGGAAEARQEGGGSDAASGFMQGRQQTGVRAADGGALRQPAVAMAVRPPPAWDIAVRARALLVFFCNRGFHNCARLMLSFLLDPALSDPDPAAAAAAGDTSVAGTANATHTTTGTGVHRLSKGLLQEAYSSYSASATASAPEALGESARPTPHGTAPAAAESGTGAGSPASCALARAASAAFAALLSQVQVETGLGLLLHAVRSGSADTVDLVLRASRALGAPLDVMEEGPHGVTPVHLAALLPASTSSAPVVQLLLDHAASCAAAPPDIVKTANTNPDTHVSTDASGGLAGAHCSQPAVAQRQTSSSNLDLVREPRQADQQPVATGGPGGVGDASAVHMPAPLARALLPAPVARRGGSAAGPTVALLGEELLRLAAQSSGGAAAASGGGSDVGWAASGGSLDTAAYASDGLAALLSGGHLLSDTKGPGAAAGTASDVGAGAVRCGREGEAGAGSAEGVEAEAGPGLLVVMGGRDSTGSSWSASEPSLYSTPRQVLEGADAGMDVGTGAVQQSTVQGSERSAGSAGMWVQGIKLVVVLVPVLLAVGLAWVGVGRSLGGGGGAEGGLGGFAHEAVWWVPIVLGGLVVCVAGGAACVAIRKVMKMPIADEVGHAGQQE